MLEVWLPVLGYEGLYEVSNFGNVKSLARIDHRGRNWKESIIGGMRKSGYMICTLSKKGKKRQIFIHKLVMEAFVGKKPFFNSAICHGDGNPSNCNLINLRYDTPKGNSGDTIIHGRTNRGYKHWSNKLTNDQVLSIYKDNRSCFIISKEYPVSETSIRDIKTGRSWAWLTMP